MPLPSVRSASAVPACDIVAVPYFTGPVPAVPDAPGLPGTDFLEAAGFKGDLGEAVIAPGSAPSEATTNGGAPVRVTLAVGLGPAAEVTIQKLRQASALAARRARRQGCLALTLASAAPQGTAPGAAAAAVAEGALLGSYDFLDWKSEPKARALSEIVVVSAGDAQAIDGPVERAATVASAVAFARDLVNTPAGAKQPVEIARVVSERAREAGVEVDVWDLDRIAAEKLGGLIGVNQGADAEPRLVRFEYNPPGEPTGFVALVGKGITFDSGGLSIKPAEGMETMKTDMSGAAAVAATMAALPALQSPVRVVGWVLFTENMPSGKAIRPGDVLRFRNGKTAEVLNTDAEGRLILADGLSLACEEAPDAVVDLATLTGAVQVALGMKVAGLYSTDDRLAAVLSAAGERAGERLWRMPMPPDYRELIDSDVADMKNTGGRFGGSITAALFLKEFVADGIPWAHLDIAGTARSDAEAYELNKGGTGWGVRTLCAWLADGSPLLAATGEPAATALPAADGAPLRAATADPAATGEPAAAVCG